MAPPRTGDRRTVSGFPAAIPRSAPVGWASRTICLLSDSIGAIALLAPALAGASSMENIANDTVYTRIAVGENSAYAAGGPLLDRTSARLRDGVAASGREIDEHPRP